ncbi:RIC1-domain-containing protein [Rickenella mellea]|uniref:RIC1-domain-containing protein n=1 Tax=Rickenella mellea TaxID=50990 RepID=A0A4Y7QMI3_9AGAM|nr:RIC1-domain-containing protein [Rickenella mellea]
MYFPTSAARQLSTVPLLPHLPPEPTIAIKPSHNKSLFCTLTRNGLAVWKVRPSAVLAYLSRTPTSLAEHGENASVYWAPDGKRIVIKTTLSFLVLVAVEYRRSPSDLPYQTPLLPSSAQRHFHPGPGEAQQLLPVSLSFEGVILVEGTLLSVSPRRHYILLSTKNPPAIQRIPWPSVENEDVDGRSQSKSWLGHDTWILNDTEFPWLIDPKVTVAGISYSRLTGVETWITSDGRAYFVQLHEMLAKEGSASDVQSSGGHTVELNPETDSEGETIIQWEGICIHDLESPRWMQKRRTPGDGEVDDLQVKYDESRRAVHVAINSRFSLIATGTYGGSVELVNFPTFEGRSPTAEALEIPSTYGQRKTGPVSVMEWSSDGYVLAVGWEHGWAVWSAGGRCLAWGFGVDNEVALDRFQDSFMFGIQDLFWVQGNFEIIALSRSSPDTLDGQLFVIPFAKSAFTEQQTPDNTRYAFLQMDDRLLVYRGADQPDMSVINPESDVWQHVKIPLDYLATNWPIKYSAISLDGRLIAVAGRKGLTHYSTTSGRWKLFEDRIQEQAFTVKGGLLWFHHVLIAAVDLSKSYQIRLYSRDLELSNQNVLHREVISSPVITLSLVDNSLLVYSAENTLSHYLIVPTSDKIQLHLCGSISFNGIITVPSVVRGLSWMIPNAQKQMGDPVDDLAVATVLMMVGGKLVLLRPRKSADQEVKYDMQILSDRIEFCWIHLRGIGTLENSLWGYDGRGIRVWLNALNIDSNNSLEDRETHESVQESVNIPLDFYPLSALMDKGIIIGVEHETATRQTLPFVLFRHSTSSHLFLHHILQCHLEANEVKQAVSFASHYEDLVYFSHALEILLHTVVESEADMSSSDDVAGGNTGVLPSVIEFLDHFDACLEVVVGCARKTEMARWKRLFDVVGSPKVLFETCLASNQLKTAGSYLLVLHNLEQLDEGNRQAIRLLNRAVELHEWQFCRELLRFLHSVDETGLALRDALLETNFIPAQGRPTLTNGDSGHQ